MRTRTSQPLSSPRCSADDLALKVDTFYGVVKMPEPDWYLGQELTEDGVRVGKTGIFPANYVEAVADEEELVRLNAGGKGGTKPVQAKLSIAATEVRTEPLAQSASKKADKPAAKKGGGGVATRGGGGDKKAWSPVTMAERQLPMKDCCGAMYTRKSSQFGLYAHFLTMNAAQIWIIVGAVAMLWAIPLCDNSGQYGRYLCGDDAIPADLAYHIDQFTMDGPLDGPKSPPFITPSRLPKSVITAMDGINTRDTLNIKTSFTQSVGHLTLLVCTADISCESCSQFDSLSRYMLFEQVRWPEWGRRARGVRLRPRHRRVHAPHGHRHLVPLEVSPLRLRAAWNIASPVQGDDALRRDSPHAGGEFSLFTVPFRANTADDLTRSPSYI